MCWYLCHFTALFREIQDYIMKEEFEDTEDLLKKNRLYFVIDGVRSCIYTMYYLMLYKYICY